MLPELQRRWKERKGADDELRDAGRDKSKSTMWRERERGNARKIALNH